MGTVAAVMLSSANPNANPNTNPDILTLTVTQTQTHGARGYVATRGVTALKWPGILHSPIAM